MDGHAVNGVARTVKGAGVPVAATGADGGPGLSAQIDARGQHGPGGGILRRAVGQRAVDQTGEPAQLVGGGDLIGVLLGTRASGLGLSPCLSGAE